jgi:hypothetical protein
MACSVVVPLFDYCAVSILIGIAIADGLIADIDQPLPWWPLCTGRGDVPICAPVELESVRRRRAV